MFKNRVIVYIFLVTLIVGILFPFVNIYFIYPSFTALLVENTENEAVRVGRHLSELYFRDGGPVSAGDIKKIEPLVREHVRSFNLIKMKIFAPDGKTIYSTDAKDIGVLNKHDYFHNLVAKGVPFSKVAKKDTRSLEGQIVTRDVVESYVPIVSGGQFIGAFEIYYDITERDRKLSAVVFRSSVIPVIITFCIMILSAIILFRLDRRMSRQKQDELQRIAEKLQKSNRELQDFANVASHDLQEPLRKITTFGDRLKTKYSAVLDEPGRDYLERMQSAANRMQLLIEGLLAFSRVATKAMPFEKVDLNIIAKEVLSDLEVRIQETRGRVDIDPLPALSADPLQMRQLLQNLIGNALKFHKEEQQPVIRVSASDCDISGTSRNENKVCRITVEDNGIGFDEKYTERIFGVFQRLHGRQEYEGSGIGLSVCRRIVERHGGDITVRSSPGNGATFVITLPVEHENGEVND